MKDYYAILGVVPTAEDVVIRAAWKALAQRYHPDRFTGNSAEAHARMAEINEAYNILSNSEHRKAYDKQRGGKESSFGDWVHEEEADKSANIHEPHDKDWAIAVKFYPDLNNINQRLSKISNLLAFSFRAYLLENKAFEDRASLAMHLETAFLKTYFGENPGIVDFARELVLAGNKNAAKALNEAVRVLGSSISSDVVINRIRKDFDIETEEMKEQRLWKEASAERWSQKQNAEKEWMPKKDGGAEDKDNLIAVFFVGGMFIFVVALFIFIRNAP